MKIPQFLRPGTVLLCSSAACAILAGLAGAYGLSSRTYEYDARGEVHSGGQLALAYNESAPAWLAIPGRSTAPLVRTIGLNPADKVIAYRTLVDGWTVVSFHKSKLAWKGLYWVDFVPRRSEGERILVSAGNNPVSGERIQITVREQGYLRLVEVVLNGGGSLTASVMQ